MARRVKVRPGQRKTIRTPGGGSTRVGNGRDGQVDIKIKPPKR